MLCMQKQMCYMYSTYCLLTGQSLGARKPSHYVAPAAGHTHSLLQHQLDCLVSSVLTLCCCKQLPVYCLSPVPHYTASLPV